MRVILSWVGVFVLGHAACMAALGQPTLSDVPTVLHPIGLTGTTDARSRFRQIYCSVNAHMGREFPDRRPCEEALVRLGSEPGSPATSVPLPPLAARRTLLFVPGIFGACVGHLATPFSDAYPYLRSQGYRVLIAPVDGRSSSQRNAAIIDSYLEVNLRPDDELIVVGYSKGVADFLEALGSHGKSNWIKQLRAFVSVAGVVSGTPIADTFAPLYAGLLSALPLERCPPGDGAAVRSLTRKSRTDWLAAHSLPSHVRLFSLAALPATVPSNPLFLPFAAQLSTIDPRHDGQVLIRDAVLPGSYVMGYANADHWSVALPFNRSDKVDAAPFAIANAFPREVLIIAILLFAEEVLGK